MSQSTTGKAVKQVSTTLQNVVGVDVHDNSNAVAAWRSALLVVLGKIEEGVLADLEVLLQEGVEVVRPRLEQETNKVEAIRILPFELPPVRCKRCGSGCPQVALCVECAAELVAWLAERD